MDTLGRKPRKAPARRAAALQAGTGSARVARRAASSMCAKQPNPTVNPETQRRCDCCTALTCLIEALRMGWMTTARAAEELEKLKQDCDPYQ